MSQSIRSDRISESTIARIAGNILSGMDEVDLTIPVRRQQAARNAVATLTELAAQRAKVAALEAGYRHLLDAVCALWGDPEDCGACGDLGHHLRAVHDSERLCKALAEAREQLGPCRCAHRASEHYDEDSTRCRVCDCAGFRLPKVTGQE